MLIQEAKRFQKLAGIITEDMEAEVPSRLSPQEQAVYDDLTNSLDESMGGFIEKFKSYLKKGSITVALLASLLSNQATAIPVKQAIKEIPPTELLKYSNRIKGMDKENYWKLSYPWLLSSQTPSFLQNTGVQLAQHITPADPYELSGGAFIRDDPWGKQEEFLIYWDNFNRDKALQQELLKYMPESIKVLEQFMKTHDSDSKEVKQVFAALMRLQLNSKQVKGMGDLGKIKPDLSYLMKVLSPNKNEIANYIGYKTNSTAAKMAFKVMFENKIKKMKYINEAKRWQKLAGIKEEKLGYYTTPTNDPKTVQLHLTTDKKSLSKNYGPLSPKSQRKDELTPKSIEKDLIDALRNNKMDYEKSITIISDKLNIDKNKLKQDFPKNDMIYKAGSIDEIVNEALLKFRINEAEGEIDPVAEKDAEQGLKQALATLNSGVSTIKPSPKDGELKESLTLGLIAGAPGLISLLGKATNGISSLFQKDKKKGTVVGNALKKWGHQLEENYITVIGTILLKLFPSAYSGQDVHDKSTALYDHAHGVYAAMLAAAAMSSGLGAAQAHSAIAAGLEGGLTAFKASEVILLAQKIAAA